MNRLLITTGDLDGIGLEVTSKALESLGPQQGFRFYVWRSPNAQNRELTRLRTTFSCVIVRSWEEAWALRNLSRDTLVEILSDDSPAHWVETAGRACFQKQGSALITAPLSKTSIQSAKMKDIGHTQILQRICFEGTGHRPHLHMGFLGDQFNVVLGTGHIPLKDVESQITSQSLQQSLRAAQELQSLLPANSRIRKIALLGVNPHAGESGMLGGIERRLFLPFIRSTLKKGVHIEGPLVPDVAFLPENWKKYSVFIANYHDQGLIPFKMIHGFHSGIHVTLGLPFIRTSVDHGTAKDLFGTGKADPRSMTSAIKWAMRMVRAKHC